MQASDLVVGRLFSVLDTIWVFSLSIPSMMSSVSTVLGFGMKESPLLSIDISSLDRW